MFEIFANQPHFTTKDTYWNLPVKPESNLCLSIHIVAITCQLLFEFSTWILNFRVLLISRFFYNRETCEITEVPIS